MTDVARRYTAVASTNRVFCSSIALQCDPPITGKTPDLVRFRRRTLGSCFNGRDPTNITNPIPSLRLECCASGLGDSTLRNGNVMLPRGMQMDRIIRLSLRQEFRWLVRDVLPSRRLCIHRGKKQTPHGWAPWLQRPAHCKKMRLRDICRHEKRVTAIRLDFRSAKSNDIAAVSYAKRHDQTSSNDKRYCLRRRVETKRNSTA
jgi:hypothetical protein